jgi:2-oxoglutarate ferredoxin oxidoreductase subunit alpha
VLVRDDITILGAPLAKLCNENFVGVRNRILMKNIMYAGLLAALLEIDVEVIRQLLTESYGKSPRSSTPNEGRAARLRLRQGHTCRARLPCHVQRLDKTRGHVMIDGNTGRPRSRVRRCDRRSLVPDHAVDFADGRVHGLLLRGLRVDKETGRRTFAVIQAEDELAAIGMVLGANWNGARAFTATSGPGISLMSEFIGLAYYAEIPAVLFDIQRVGPSTGMPTRTQQCDILTCAYASHGDTKHVLLVPVEPGGMLLHGGPGLRPGRNACRRRCSCCRTSTSA